MRSPADSADPTRSPGAFREAAAAAMAPPAQLHCLLCKGVQHRAIFTEFGIDILRCKTCGHVFSSFRADLHYAGFWGDEVAADEHFYWGKARARMHRDFFKRFIAGRSGRLLDMGSGLGFFLKAMMPYREWDAYGCEISPAAVKYAREQLGLRKVVCSPLQDVDLPRDSFDMITMWDVIDHVPHPDPLLEHCHALLKEDGTLFIRTPNISVQILCARAKKAICGIQPGTKYLQATDHPHQYSMRSIERLLDRNGFVDVAFVHLHPVATGIGWKAQFLNLTKNACFQILRTLAVCSGGHLNYDNLFVVARKGAVIPSV